MSKTKENDREKGMPKSRFGIKIKTLQCNHTNQVSKLKSMIDSEKIKSGNKN